MRNVLQMCWSTFFKIFVLSTFDERNICNKISVVINKTSKIEAFISSQDNMNNYAFSKTHKFEFLGSNL